MSHPRTSSKRWKSNRPTRCLVFTRALPCLSAAGAMAIRCRTASQSTRGQSRTHARTTTRFAAASPRPSFTSLVTTSVWTKIRSKRLKRSIGVGNRSTKSKFPRAKKRFGQHFLQDAWADKLITVIDPRPEDHFIEIGPGPGALTFRLASRVSHLTAIELDQDMVDALEPKLP